MEQDINKKVVHKIKEIRLSKSLSQQALASDIGLDVTAYNRIENGKTQLTVMNLFAIADSLKVDVGDILQIKSNSFVNNNNLVMSNLHNGNLNISIDPKELFELIRTGNVDKFTP